MIMRLDCASLSIRLCLNLLLVAASIVHHSHAFLVSTTTTTTTTGDCTTPQAESVVSSSASSIRLFSASSSSSSSFVTFLSLERSCQREIEQFQNWAVQCGVAAENGFCLGGEIVDGNEDYFAATSTGAAQGSRLLYVPAGMILSASRIQQEYAGYLDASIQLLSSEKYQMTHLIPQFHLFVRILIEYEQGNQSPYFPWFQALPRKWNTAASMDDFCMSCLPPYIKKLCQTERDQLAAFRDALNGFEYLSLESKKNDDLMKFAYNVVFTRSWETDDYDYKIVPMADMLNHDYPENVAIRYDQDGSCEIIAKQSIAAGQKLTLNYGQPSNPSHFLATYGFINESPAFFCKMLFPKPSQELIDIGCDPSRMLFFTQDGSVSQEVWDVLLYSRLERKKGMENYKTAFYQAHMSGDEATKASIHQRFKADTVKALLWHVNYILSEVAELTVQMNSYDESKHPRLPLLRKHHNIVTSTFSNVRSFLMAFQQ